MTVGTDEENDAFAEALPRVVLTPGAARAVPPSDGARLVHARPARARPSRAARRPRRPRARGPGLLPRRPACCTAATRSGPRTQFMLECLRDLDACAARARRRAGGAARAAPSASCARLAREVGAEEVHFSADVGPFARRRADAVRGRCASAGSSWCAHPGLTVVDDLAELRTQAGKPYTVFSPFHRAWREAPRREVLGAPRKLPALPSGLRKGRLPVAGRRSGSSRRWRSRRRAARRPARERADAVPRATTSRDYADNHDALGARPHLAAVALPALRLRLGARGRGAAAARRRGRRRSAASSAGATSTTTCCSTSPRNARSEFQERYRGTIRWSHAEQALRGVVRGPHRLPAGRRRHAPAAPRGLDAQPRPARRRARS